MKALALIKVDEIYAVSCYIDIWWRSALAEGIYETQGSSRARDKVLADAQIYQNFRACPPSAATAVASKRAGGTTGQRCVTPAPLRTSS